MMALPIRERTGPVENMVGIANSPQSFNEPRRKMVTLSTDAIGRV